MVTKAFCLPVSETCKRPDHLHRHTDIPAPEKTLYY